MLKIVTITGPSCAGKTTLVRELLLAGNFCEVVSFTSRPQRANESNGVDYYFKSTEECRDIIHTGKAAEFIKFKDNFYGIEKAELEEKLSLNKTPLVIVEPHGLKQMRELYGKELYAIYVDAPVELLFERFLERFKNEVTICLETRSDAVMDIKYYASRLAGIKQEYDSWPMEGQYDFHIDHFTFSNKESIVSSLVNLLT